LNRRVQYGEGDLHLTFSGRIENTQLIQEARKVFRRPTARWTSTTPEDRLSAIAATMPRAEAFPFALATLMYYADASEALHGSAYGVLQPMGLFQPGSGVVPESGHIKGAGERLRNHLAKSYTMIYLVAGEMLATAGIRIADGDDAVKAHVARVRELRSDRIKILELTNQLIEGLQPWCQPRVISALH